MSMQSDDEQDSPVHQQHRAPVPSRFNFDDAFSDTDDNDVSYEFTPEAIRAEFEKNVRQSKEEASWNVDHDLNELMSKIGYAETDASVSTFNIDSDDRDQLSPPTQQPPSPDSRTTSHPSISDGFDDVTSEFSIVNLQSPLTDADAPAVSANGDEERTDEEPESRFAEYPAVHIDLSQEHPVPTVVRISTPTLPEPHNEPVRSSSTPSLPHNEHEHGDPEPSPQAFNVASPRPHTPQSGARFSSGSNPSLPLPTPSSSSHSHSASTFSPTGLSMASKHRSSRSAGPSMLDKVVSKTRPTFLPPKPKAEDKKHMADWEAMMKRSRAAEDKRRRALQERRLARERRIEDSVVQWEREIVPNWRVVQKDPRLRRMWWQGIPTKLRATMWQNAVGNGLALSKDAFKTYLARANRALSSGSFPSTVLGLIDDDIRVTLPALHLFVPGSGPMYQDLKDMLCAWVVARSDEGLGYVPGVARIAAMILLNMPSGPGFVLMRNLLERHCLRSFYGGMSSKEDVEAYYRIFDTLLADGMPKIYFNFKQHQISPSAYLPAWLIPLFLDHLPFEACARLWDILLLEGDAFLFRASLAILAVLEPRLFFPDKQELLDLLKGENKAALEVAKRDGRPMTAKYDIYGVDEETLWERIDGMEEWWRETTWTRLIQRELPDL